MCPANMRYTVSRNAIMQLYLSKTSPFARIVLITALRSGHENLTLHTVNPWENPPELENVNPFSQIPTLIADNGISINHTLAICGYLDETIFRGARAAQIAGYGFTVMEQFARYFTLLHRAGTLYGTPHPHIARAYEALQRALPKAPDLHPQSEDWGQYLLAVAFAFISREPDLFQRCLSPQNQEALQGFAEKPLMHKTTADALDKAPKTATDL